MIRFGKSPIIVRNLDGSDTTGDHKSGERWLPKMYFVFPSNKSFIKNETGTNYTDQIPHGAFSATSSVKDARLKLPAGLITA